MGLCDSKYCTFGLFDLFCLESEMASSKQGNCLRLARENLVGCTESAWSTSKQQDAVVKRQAASAAGCLDPADRSDAAFNSERIADGQQTELSARASRLELALTLQCHL